MAGMLPGVEAARRRRFHHSNLIDGAGAGATRRSSFCLYATNHSHQLNISPSSSMEREAGEEEKLDATAREAKKRLDHRLHTHFRSAIKRGTRGREASIYYVEGRLKEEADVQTDVYKEVKSGYQIFKAIKLPKLPFGS